LTDTNRELQDRADIATVTSHLATLERLEKADRLRSPRITGRSARSGRISPSNRPTSRPQNYRRFLWRTALQLKYIPKVPTTTAIAIRWQARIPCKTSLW